MLAAYQWPVEVKGMIAAHARCLTLHKYQHVCKSLSDQHSKEACAMQQSMKLEDLKAAYTHSSHIVVPIDELAKKTSNCRRCWTATVDTLDSTDRDAELTVGHHEPMCGYQEVVGGSTILVSTLPSTPVAVRTIYAHQPVRSPVAGTCIKQRQVIDTAWLPRVQHAKAHSLNPVGQWTTLETNI